METTKPIGQHADDYLNGLRFGFAHARRWGTPSLMGETRFMGNMARLTPESWRSYAAGVCDAALALVQS